MTQVIDQAFKRQFETEFSEAFQRRGSYLRGTVREKTAQAASVQFLRIGSGEATVKPRHGTVTPMNADRAPVIATMKDFYAPEYVDKLDELKIQHNERKAIQTTIVAALGRAIDNEILTAMNDSTKVNPNQPTAWNTAAKWTTVAGPIEVMEVIGAENVLEEGEVTAVVSWQAWGDLMNFSQFASADFVRDKPFSDGPGFGHPGRRWLGINWFPFSGLPSSGSGNFWCFFYAKRAVGLGINQNVTVDISWVPERAAWLFNGMLSCGAEVIDRTGVFRFNYLSA